MLPDQAAMLHKVLAVPDTDAKPASLKENLLPAVGKVTLDQD
jgi:hypothetical protein